MSDDTLANGLMEIRPPPSKAKLPDRIEVYISRVQPQQCSSLLKDLQQGFGNKEEALAHLKRVRRCTVPTNVPPPIKKPKTTNSSAVLLEVLIGLAEHKHRWSFLEKKYSLQLEKRCLPGRPVESQQEREEFNKEWPTIYFHKQSVEHQQQELELSLTEIKAMQEGMQYAIEDAIRAREFFQLQGNAVAMKVNGAVIMCPTSGRVVARANDECKMQQSDSGVPDVRNPLCTSTLLAIQGVSRKERAAAVGHGMDSVAFQKGQYLCTGYVT
jgi:hypothetical protein